MNEWPIVEPKNLDIAGRELTDAELDKLRPHFDGLHYLIDTITTVENNIAKAKDTEAASIWVQWLLNAGLQSFDTINQLIEGKDV
tara:strand:- start:17051 stop:17305 length:255 start_codon:yes stop_codon:yes gene_type:complete